MNTRLQVEHPVTECVTGVDLFARSCWSRPANRCPSLKVALNVATRSNAGFTPRTRRRVFFRRPAPSCFYKEPQGPGIRVDSGIAAHGEVSVHYDPMLAKVIVWAETREAARRRAIAALRDYAILGIHTNIPFLLRILEHPQFIDAAVDTGFLDREGANIATGLSTDLPEAAMAALKEHQRTVDTRATSTLGTLGTQGALATDPFLTLGRWRG